jgi:prenyltransferase beta subunit
MNPNKKSVLRIFLLLCKCFLIAYLCPDISEDKIQIAVDKGLKYLLKSQNQKTGQIGNSSYYIGSTALSGLAMFAAGYTPYSGKFGLAIEKAAHHILKNQRKNGYITEDTNQSRFHGHSYALIFLTYVYSELKNTSSLLDRDSLKQKIKKAIKVLEDFQLPDGGFPYSPGENMSENSTVVCCVSALRSAKDAGFKVKEKVIKKGIEYIRKCANPDGSFAYNLGQRSAGPIMTVNGMMNLIFYGSWKDSDLIKKGFKNVKNLYETGELFQGWEMEYYGTFYAALALYYMDEELWKKWFAKVSEKLISAQREDGSWQANNYGVATQFALLILQIPKKLLPLFIK